MTVSTPFVLAAASMVLFGLADFALKRAADMGVRPVHTVMVQAWFFSSLVAIYAFLSGNLVPSMAALWGAAAGLFILIGFTAFVKSLMGGAVSIQAPVFRLNFIVTAIIAIAILGEPLTAMKSVALLLALFAVWLLLGGGRVTISRKALAQVTLACVAFGLANVMHKVGLSRGGVPETMVVTQAAVFVSLATLQAFLSEKRIAPPPSAFIYPPLSAVLLVGAFVLLLRGLATGEASVLVPISQMGFVVTAALGIAVLHEPLTARKAAGLGAAILSLAAFAV